MKLILKFIHLSSLTVWFGGTVFISIMAKVMFTNFPKDQAGDIMAAIFPIFYRVGYAASFTALITLILLCKKRAWFRSLLISVMLLATLYGGLVAGEKANHLRLEMKHEQNSSRLTVLKDQFHTQHGQSMISIVVVLVVFPTVLLLTAGGFPES